MLVKLVFQKVPWAHFTERRQIKNKVNNYYIVVLSGKCIMFYEPLHIYNECVFYDNILTIYYLLFLATIVCVLISHTFYNASRHIADPKLHHNNIGSDI